MHCFILILVLGPLILALYHNSGREMRDSDRRRCLVDMLSTGSARTVRVNSDIIIVDLDIKVFLDIRHYIAGYEGCLSLSVCVERGNSYKAVYASLGL